MTTARWPRVEIVMDEVVLRGVAPEAAPRVASALEARLRALAQEWAAAGGGTGGAPTSRDEASRRLPAVAPRASSPAALGNAVAAAVWDAVVPGGRS